MLKPASYRLTVGKDYAMGGEVHELIKGKNEKMILDPFQCAILSTAERINMPRFLIGRWNLRVKLVYKGLLWLGGPQVDPGYCGNLFCPIFNLSNEPVEFKLGQKLALIDFVRTTNYNKESKEYGRPPERTTIWDYETGLQSALYAEARKRVDKMENDLIHFRSRLNTFITTNLTILSVIIAALSIIVVVSEKPISIDIWSFMTFSLSISAFIISCSVYWKYWKTPKKNEFKRKAISIIKSEKEPKIKALINVNLFKEKKKRKKS